MMSPINNVPHCETRGGRPPSALGPCREAAPQSLKALSNPDLARAVVLHFAERNPPSVYVLDDLMVSFGPEKHDHQRLRAYIMLHAPNGQDPCAGVLLKPHGVMFWTQQQPGLGQVTTRWSWTTISLYMEEAIIFLETELNFCSLPQAIEGSLSGHVNMRCSII